MIRKNSLSFQANIHSPKLRFKQEDFFVHIRGYGKNSNWANDIKKTADLAVDLFRRDTDIENVLKLISLGVKNANKTNTLDLTKKLFSGFLRVPRKDWASKPWTNLVTPYNKGKYNNYRNRLDYIAAHPLHPTQAPDYSRPIINNDETIVIDLLWESSDSNIVTVDQNGHINAINVGSTSIFVYDEVSGLGGEIVINVKESEKEKAPA